MGQLEEVNEKEEVVGSALSRCVHSLLFVFAFCLPSCVEPSTFARRATVDILRVARHPKLTRTMARGSEGWAVQGSNLRQPACKAGALPLS